VPTEANPPANKSTTRSLEDQAEVEAIVGTSELVHRNGVRRVLGKLAPGILGGALFLLNNLGVIHALFASPPGYSPLGVQRNVDIAQYLTWLGGLKTEWILPNYHAPWITPPGLIVPGLFPVAALERLFSIKQVVALQLFSLGGYVAVAYALAFAYSTFFKTRKQAFTAFLISLACVPLASLPGVFKLLHGVLPVLGWSAGAQEFMTVSEGFLHSLITWPFLAYGTCGQVLAMSLLARYCRSHEQRWLRWLAVVCFFAALIHPFEIFVIVSVTAIMLLREAEPITHRLARIGAILVAAGAGLSPYVIQSLRVPWVHEATNANRPDLYIAPAYLLATLGIPAILVVLLLLFGLPKNRDRDVLVLKTWLVSILLIFYVPGVPLALHMLDGVFFAIGILLTIQIQELAESQPILARPALRFLIAIAVIWMVLPHVLFRVRCWKDGTAISKIKFASAIAPNDEFAALEWLRKNASPSDLVLASEEAAPWLATAPVHSFASHWLFSSAAARPRDAELRASFFEGKLPSERAHELLETLGVRFVVVPDGSGARSYLENATMRAHFNSTAIYELPGAQMKKYEDSRIVQLGK
jgi:hypothetical protein